MLNFETRPTYDKVKFRNTLYILRMFIMSNSNFQYQKSFALSTLNFSESKFQWIQTLDFISSVRLQSHPCNDWWINGLTWVAVPCPDPIQYFIFQVDIFDMMEKWVTDLHLGWVHSCYLTKNPNLKDRQLRI